MQPAQDLVELCVMADDRYKQPGREELVSFTFWTSPKLRNDVKRLSIDIGKTVQELMEEAAKDLLSKYGKRSKKKD